MDDMMSLYIDDTKEYLAILNESIIELEKHPDDKAAISEMFRAYHTMKSSTAAMDFKRTADFIHHMEDMLHEMREGRLAIHAGIIALLYESYDYLEKFLYQVMESGKEGNLAYEELMIKVDEFLFRSPIQECGTCNEHAGLITSGNDVAAGGFMLGEDDILKAKREASAGNHLYRITVRLMLECAFKAVRAWMIFEDIGKISKIIYSYPVLPKSEDFLNGSFQFNDTILYVLASSDSMLDDVFQELAAIPNEIDEIHIEEMEPERNDSQGTGKLRPIPGSAKRYPDNREESVSQTIDRIIGKDNGKNDENFAAFTEIMEKIKKCELLLIEMEAAHYSNDVFPEIMAYLYSIQEISNDIGYGMISDIIRQIGSLGELFLHRQLEPDIVSAGLIADLLKFAKRLCEKPELNENKLFIEEVNQKYKQLSEYQSLADRLGKQKRAPEQGKLGEILVKTGSMRDEDVAEIISLQKERYPDLKFGQIAVRENKADVKDVLGALHVQENIRSDQKNISYIRIPANKVDNLVDHLGELLITQSLHRQEITSLLGKDGGKAFNNIMRMERIAREIQDITMSLRMVSLKQTFQKIYRIGRDTAVELGKDISIETFGEETEIDRNIVDKLHDPLMHLIRNSISHGIEETDERTAAGKPGAGYVAISASNRKGNVYIEISDDGKGLSIDKIYSKALEKELIDPQRKYTEDEILRFIYLPGFSTLEKVNSISGRGVGMNVVQTEIVKLGGKIDIVNKPGQGCSFILKIPVNLSTINGTIVEIAGNNYIIPTLSIKQILKPQEDQWVSIKGIVSSLMVRNEIIPVIPAGCILQSDENDKGSYSGIVIVVEHEQELMALPVKAILGKQEVVVKQLGSDFSNLDFVSGATILGDGRVSLILDVEALFKWKEEPVRAS
jgi:two-component system chemotaxis sensor kinase CheA